MKTPQPRVHVGLDKGRHPPPFTGWSGAPGISSASAVGPILCAAGEGCALSLEPGKHETRLHGIVWWTAHSGYGWNTWKHLKAYAQASSALSRGSAHSSLCTCVLGWKWTCWRDCPENSEAHPGPHQLGFLGRTESVSDLSNLCHIPQHFRSTLRLFSVARLLRS